MKKRLTLALAAGALMATMVPGVAQAEDGQFPGEPLLVVRGPDCEFFQRLRVVDVFGVEYGSPQAACLAGVRVMWSPPA